MAMMETLKKLLCRVPWKAWLAVGGLLAGAFWLQQHDARIRRQARLQQLQNQTSAQVSALRSQAAQAVRQANVENKKVLQELEQRRQQAEQQNLQLAAQLSALRRQAQIQAAEVATLPTSEIVTRVAAQLGLKAEDVAGKEQAASRQGAKAQDKLRMTNDELQKGGAGSVAGMTEMTPHPAAGASTLSPRRGPGQRSFAGTAKNAIAAPPDSVTRKKQTTGILRSAQDDRGRAQDDGQRGQDDRDAALALTASGARKVETALVELNACRAENDIETRQASTCQARAEADEAALKRQAGSVASLNQALQAKDEILARQQSEYKAELRAARGTFLGRLAHAAEHVAIGVAVGVAIGVAVK